MFKDFRIVTNNYWSDGGGRYIAGQVPDLIAQADGDPSLIHAYSTVSGIEYTHKNTMFMDTMEESTPAATSPST
ncbi:MAG: hypothetical protein U0V70_05670 [Terriglobia bacterium]